MKNGLVKGAILNQYHRAAYHLYGYVSSVMAGVYIIHQIDLVAELQKKTAMKAHSHRVWAAKAIEP